MAINPITVTRLPVISMTGHSNCDGWGATDFLFARQPHLAPGGDLRTNPAGCYWNNIYVATGAQPFPEANGTPVASSSADVAWLEMTIANKAKRTDPHPHPSPWDYPNTRGSCYPRHAYWAWIPAGFAFDEDNSPTGTWFSSPNDPGATWGMLHGVEIPLMWAWRHFWNQQVGMVKVAFSSTFSMSTEFAFSAEIWLETLNNPAQFSPLSSAYVETAVDIFAADPPFYAYWTPNENFDFAPQTNKLYRLWFERMQGAAAALPPGCQLDVQLHINWHGDNEAGGRTLDALRVGWEAHVRSYIKRIRRDLVTNNWTTLPEHQIPIIWPKVHFAYGFGINDVFCNTILEKVAADDPYLVLIDTNDLGLLDDGGYVPLAIAGGNHFSDIGYATMAERVFNAWRDMREDAFDALDLDDTITVQQAMDRVRLYYQKSRANNDLQDDYVLQHLNAAMFHCLNHVGDNAWWLRRREQRRIQSGANEIVTLPRYIHRLLKIEPEADPKYALSFQQIGFGEGGKLQINLDERTSGTFWLHFITMPKPLTRTEQILPAPQNIAEWIVVETCKRIAAASSNIPLQAHFQAQCDQLMRDSLRNMAQMQRSKRDTMRTQRRGYRLGYRYNRNIWSWGSDSSQ